MKDTEARQGIKRVESKSDKIRRSLEVEIRAGQSKDDKERSRLIERVDALGEQLGVLWEKYLKLEVAWYSKFERADPQWVERTKREEDI